MSAREHAADIRKVLIPVLKDGVAVGIVQLMKVDLADDVTFSNHLDDQSDGGWLQVLHTFPQPIRVSSGAQLDVVVGHDRTSLIVMPAPRAPRQEARQRKRLSAEVVVGARRPVARGNPGEEPERREGSPGRD